MTAASVGWAWAEEPSPSAPGVHWVLDLPQVTGRSRPAQRATRLARPLLVGGSVFLRMRTGLLDSEHDLLIGLDPLTGAERFSRELGIIGGPAADEEIVACRDAILVAHHDTLHLFDGEELASRWSFREHRLLKTTFTADRLAVADSAEVIVAAGTNGRILGITARTGEQLWAHEQRAELVAAGPTRVVTAIGDEVRCLDATTGELVWGFSCPDVVRCLVHRDGTVLLGCRDRRLYAIELESGTVHHETALSLPMGRSLCTNGSSALVASTDRQASFELRSGRLLWSARFGSVSHPVLAGGAALVDDGRVLECLDATTGAQRWAIDLGEAVTFSDRRDGPSELGPPLVTDQMVIVPTNGAVIGLGPGGSPSWEPPVISGPRPV